MTISFGAGQKYIVITSKHHDGFAMYHSKVSNYNIAKGSKSATVEIDLGTTYAIGALALVEPWHPWSNVKQTHELPYWNGTNWEKIIKTTTDGTGSMDQFSKVNAQKIRVVLQNEHEPPSLCELILYRTE